ncbi:MAG: DUF362 domain-containing protein [Clostridia bacterium]|nr:DUF362 domain-containing protein [Clostridia bacterium]
MGVKVYFSKTITPDEVVRLYKTVGVELSGNVAVKVHSGEEGNQNFLKPSFWKPMANEVCGTVVECNTAYDGARNTTAKHIQLIKKHGWNDTFEKFDLMDAEGPDAELPVENGRRINKDIVGKNLLKYDSLLVLAHFKGHPMGGYGGALKQLSIGCASSRGKELIHGGGDFNKVWICEQDAFLEAMADAASAVAKHFDGKAVYINVMKNLSVDCDCCAVAEDPCMRDIGILASTDPIAIDQACIDLIYAAKDDPGQAHFIERVERQNGIHTIEAAAELGFGTREYELIEI